MTKCLTCKNNKVEKPKDAYYNLPNLKAKYCKDHQLENMINVRTIYCKIENCKKVAVKGYEKREYCEEHSNDNMKDFNKKKECAEEGCNTVPHFGFKVATHCKEHCEKGMKQFGRQKCIFENCNIDARYNYINEKGSRYCKEHKLEGMKDKNKAICIIENCEEYASFKDEKTNKNLYCTYHSKEIKNIKLISSKNKICKFENCDISANFGTLEDPKQYCKDHYNIIYKNSKNKHKNNEKKIIELLDKNNIKYIYDKTIGNKKYRPDFLINCKTHYIILEIDENQHKIYDKEKELARMKIICKELKLLCIILRFNPNDFYINNNRKRISINIKLNDLLKYIIYYKNTKNLTKNLYIQLYYNCSCNNKCNYIHEIDFI